MKRETVSPRREWTAAGVAGDETRLNCIRTGTTDRPAGLWRAILLIGSVSALMNLLMLVSVIFVVGVFREVIPKHDVNRLLALLAIVILAYVFYALLRLGHARVLRGLADAIEQDYERAAFRAAAKSPVAAPSAGYDAPVRDLGRVRTFILEGALAGLFDLPWTFVFVAMLSLFNILLGVVSLTFALATAALVAAADHLSGWVRESNLRPSPYLRAILADEGVVRAFGLTAQFEERWVRGRERNRRAQRSSQWLSDLLRSLARAARMLNPIIVLALAVYLALQHLADFGIVIATGILVRRISEPIDTVARSWSNIVAARGAWFRLKQYQESAGRNLVGRTAPLPASGAIVVERLSGGPPGRDKWVFRPVSFELSPGESLGIVGPSGCGKSALANVIAGTWMRRSGRMLIGGLDRFQLSDEEAAQVIGYAPQHSRFFDGSIADNISSFATQRDERRLLNAVKLAGLEQFIVRMAAGLDTQIDSLRIDLPGGIRQRLVLARAIYRDPCMLVLDDPTSSLDQDGKRCLLQILRTHKERRGAALICTNELPLLLDCDHVLFLELGQDPRLGTREELLQQEDADVTNVRERAAAAISQTLSGAN
jgi:ATP-binding cassette, subfamily C, bacterial exporter for protease/lipase